MYSITPRSHYDEEIWKRSFDSTARSTVYTNPSWKQSFTKTLFKPEEFENAALRFSVDAKHFENGAFRKRWGHDGCGISLTEFSSNTNPKSIHLMRFQIETSIFKFLRRNVDGKHLMHFQSENAVFKFPRRSVDGALTRPKLP